MLFRSVKGGIEGVKIFAVEIILCDAQRVAEALEVHQLALAQEFDGVAHVGVVDQAQDVVVGHAGLLLWGDFVRTTLHNII